MDDQVQVRDLESAQRRGDIYLHNPHLRVWRCTPHGRTLTRDPDQPAHLRCPSCKTLRVLSPPKPQGVLNALD